MVPARNLLRRHYDSYGSCFSELLHQPRRTMKAPLMAEEKTKIGINEEEDEEEEGEEEETGTSSKEEEEEEEDDDNDDDDDGWLQLGIGSRNVKTPKMPGEESRRLMELPLFSDKPPSGGGGTGSHSVANTSSVFPLFPAMGQQVRPWGLWTTTPLNPMFASSSNRYDFRHQYMYPRSQLCMSEVSQPVATGLRIVNPPRRPLAGVWFILQTKHNQGREPFLPQIPKSYLRIRDGRMTVRLLKKYLVNKLGLEDESQVEITCRGQGLLPSWTLQYVRDNVWFSGDTMTVFLPESPAADQVMILQYGPPARSI